jgi:hypothetical protein
MFNLSDLLRVVAALLVAGVIIVGAIMLPTLLGPSLPPLPTMSPTPAATPSAVVAASPAATGTPGVSPTPTTLPTSTEIAATPSVADTGAIVPAATPSATATRPPHTATPARVTPTATAAAPTPTATATPVPTPEPTRDLCAELDGYAWVLEATEPLLVPPAGSVALGPQQELLATWTFVNSGACAWPRLRFEFSRSSRSSAPVASPRLATQSDATSPEIQPGERVEAVLMLAAREVPANAIDWTWMVTVLVERPDGVQVMPLGELRLAIGRAWVAVATATPRPTPAIAQLPTSTPTSPPPPAPPRLLRPSPAMELRTFQGEETFSGYDVSIEFRWEQDGRSLQPDEYYVVAIIHAQGEEYRWAGQDTWYRPPSTPEGSLGWLLDLADQMGRLWWRVLVVRTNAPKQVGPPGPDDVIVARSADGSFRWVKPGPSSGGDSQSPGGGIE